MRPLSGTSEHNGLALAVGGALALISLFLGLTTVGSFTWVPYVSLGFCALPAGVLVQIGLHGLYEGQATQAGHLGRVGFATASFGALVATGVVCGASIEAVVAWNAVELFEPGASRVMRHGLTVWFTILLLGLTLFGYSMFKARVYPRGATVMLMVGSVLTLVEVVFVFLPTGLMELPVSVVVVGTLIMVTALFRLGFEISSGPLYRLWKWLPKPRSRHRSRREG